MPSFHTGDIRHRHICEIGWWLPKSLSEQGSCLEVSYRPVNGRKLRASQAWKTSFEPSICDSTLLERASLGDLNTSQCSRPTTSPDHASESVTLPGLREIATQTGQYLTMFGCRKPTHLTRSLQIFARSSYVMQLLVSASEIRGLQNSGEGHAQGRVIFVSNGWGKHLPSQAISSPCGYDFFGPIFSMADEDE
ncbi:hypothetical protein BCR37DRAFT_376195 [Protomyces lactucae-debilis]|uniref:Uncharacterized protein n=1 Tax=Protomyces lactucae-debilis TaxID=2754530 RepID=A0A1Y2FSJ4_PROLT|nr:uncharacterized protein BCR37DRAFT_376195 [Protomyces lactucae-debilis]ORY86909.1 hypothetical protein BCR37DRAFT_376195 [Protomyces lactucae-debilis]